MSGTASGWIKAVRTGWWIALLAAVVGGIAGTALASRGGATYVAKASLTVDTVALNTYGRMPKQDSVIAAAKSAESVAAIAGESGLTAAQVASGLKVFSTGTQQSALSVQFTSGDSATAKRVAGIAGKRLAAEAARLSNVYLDTLRTAVADDDEALAVLEKSAAADPSKAYELWQVKKTRAAEADTLSWLEGAYSPVGAVSVAATSKRTATLSGAAGGAFAGLFLGALLVIARELASRRGGASA